MSLKKELPRSDFAKTVGNAIVLYLADTDDLAPLDLPMTSGRLECRLVGVDRPGVWVEPKSWFEESVKAETPVQHVFIKWDNVLGLTRAIDVEKFEDKKEYRGLRPRH